MRNRYLVTVATALMVVMLVAATGCKSNPEKAKKKYLESGMSYVDKKQYDAALIQFKRPCRSIRSIRRHTTNSDWCTCTCRGRKTRIRNSTWPPTSTRRT